MFDEYVLVLTIPFFVAASSKSGVCSINSALNTNYFLFVSQSECLKKTYDSSSAVRVLWSIFSEIIFRMFSVSASVSELKICYARLFWRNRAKSVFKSYSIMALPRLDNSEQLASDMMSSSLVVSSPSSSPLMTSSVPLVTSSVPLVTSSVASSVTVFCVSQLLGCDLIATLLKFFNRQKLK